MHHLLISMLLRPDRTQHSVASILFLLCLSKMLRINKLMLRNLLAVVSVLFTKYDLTWIASVTRIQPTAYRQWVVYVCSLESHTGSKEMQVTELWAQGLEPVQYFFSYKCSNTLKYNPQSFRILVPKTTNGMIIELDSEYTDKPSCLHSLSTSSLVAEHIVLDSSCSCWQRI